LLKESLLKESFNKSSFNFNFSPGKKCSIITMSAEIQFAHQDNGWEYKQACLSCGINSATHSNSINCYHSTISCGSNRPTSALSTTYSNMSSTSRNKKAKGGLIRKGSNFSSKTINTSMLSVRGSLNDNSCDIFKIERVKEDEGLGSLSAKRFINTCHHEFNMASPKSPD